MSESNAIKNLSVLNLRLSALMKEKGFSISSLSRKTGISVASIQRLVTEADSNPTIASLGAISRELNTSISYLIGETIEVDKASTKSVPLISWMQAIDFHSNELASIEKTVGTNADVSEDAFAIVMKGASMEPHFPEGTLLIFDPQKEPDDGDYVLIKLIDFEKPLFKQIIINDPPDIYVRSTNSLSKESALRLLNKEDKVLATLVQSQIEY